MKNKHSIIYYSVQCLRLCMASAFPVIASLKMENKSKVPAK